MSAHRTNAAGGGFNPYVHGARGLFSVMVFVFHVANSGWGGLPVPDGGAGHFTMISFQYGVELFFGISGFVIIGALERSPSVAQFAWDRFTRIYPVLWATIAVIVGAALATHQPLPDLRSILLNVVVVPPYVMVAPLNPPAWSLTWEIAFYALCAIGFAFRRHRIAVPAVVAIGLASTVVFPRTMLMLPGLLIGIGRMRIPIVRRLSRQPALCLIAFLLSWHGLGMLAGDGPHQINPIHLPFWEWLAFVPGVLAVTVLGTAALLGIVDGVGWFGRMLGSAPMRWLGTISYSFYLWHPIALHAAKIALGRAAPGIAASPFGALALACVGAPIALCLATASQRLIEVRVTRWLRQRAGESRREATVTTSSLDLDAPDPHAVRAAGEISPTVGAS